MPDVPGSEISGGPTPAGNAPHRPRAHRGGFARRRHHPARPTIGRLDLFLKASWGVGGLGTTSMLYLVNMFVLFFLVRHVGIPAAIAGALLAATRFYDAVIDPLIGSLSDRTEGRWGRRRPWMLVGALLSPLACIALFNPPALPNRGSRLYAAVLGGAAVLLRRVFAVQHPLHGAGRGDDRPLRRTRGRDGLAHVLRLRLGHRDHGGRTRAGGTARRRPRGLFVMSFAAAAVVGARCSGWPCSPDGRPSPDARARRSRR